MIIRWNSNVATFSRHHGYLLLAGDFANPYISKTIAAAANNEIEQSRTVSRFVFSRIFGRVN